MPSLPRLLLSTALLLLLSSPTPTHAIKFSLEAYRYPPSKCIWNAAHANALVIVTANVGPGADQRVDIEIVDSSPKRNVLLSKKALKSESRLAVTMQSEGEVGVCFKNHITGNVSPEVASKLERVIDLDVDIGADAVDYNAIANQESLSGLETEMRKLEGIVKEIVDELGYLKAREERFTKTNSASPAPKRPFRLLVSRRTCWLTGTPTTASTNERVQKFAWFTLCSLTGLGVWQIFHLRAFFKRKYLID
ncbi:hypothetical protein H0H81_003189 [Sphagnurus paluster]|uniref:GOLD domain-containing protein n=1 Tax=Sphagnurus paluster TaxID=117069 RepID=A0A9P7FZP6_9AGAR|nr:hypothetical protein H0H81_003189 [Sphagnurus paluster]